MVQVAERRAVNWEPPAGAGYPTDAMRHDAGFPPPSRVVAPPNRVAAPRPSTLRSPSARNVALEMLEHLRSRPSTWVAGAVVLLAIAFGTGYAFDRALHPSAAALPHSSESSAGPTALSTPVGGGQAATSPPTAVAAPGPGSSGTPAPVVAPPSEEPCPPEAVEAEPAQPLIVAEAREPIEEPDEPVQEPDEPDIDPTPVTGATMSRIAGGSEDEGETPRSSDCLDGPKETDWTSIFMGVER